MAVVILRSAIRQWAARESRSALSRLARLAFGWERVLSALMGCGKLKLIEAQEQGVGQRVAALLSVDASKSAALQPEQVGRTQSRRTLLFGKLAWRIPLLQLAATLFASQPGIRPPTRPPLVRTLRSRPPTSDGNQAAQVGLSEGGKSAQRGGRSNESCKSESRFSCPFATTCCGRTRRGQQVRRAGMGVRTASAGRASSPFRENIPMPSKQLSCLHVIVGVITLLSSPDLPPPANRLRVARHLIQQKHQSLYLHIRLRLSSQISPNGLKQTDQRSLLTHTHMYLNARNQ